MSLDIRTLIVLLSFGDLVSAGILALCIRPEGRRLQEAFLAGRLLQAVAWGLLALRAHIPDLWSVQVGNGALLAGFAMEAAALAAVFPTWPKGRRLLALVGALGVLAFWALGHTPAQRVAVASLATAATFGSAALLLIRGRSCSRFPQTLGWAYATATLPLLARAGLALPQASPMSLLVPGIVQTLAFLPLFVLMVMGSVGFPLMLEEREAQRLRDSQATLSAVFRLSPVSLVITRMEDGRIRACNPAFEALSGHPKAVLLEKTVLELGCYPDSGRREALLEALTREGLVEHEDLSLQKADGTMLEVELSAVPLACEGGRHVLSTFTDVTRRKREAEEREGMILDLQQALAKVRTLSGLLPICAGCKKIRDDRGYWSQIEQYLRSHSEAEFTHGLCPDCVSRYYPDTSSDESP